MTIRLISSGIDRSRLRRPASTCASGTPSLAVTSAHASVELTSPTTTTTSAASSKASGSKAVITRQVCTAWLPEPAPRKWSGRRMARSSKNTSLIAGS